jgi:hypothetical protein
MPTSIAEQFIDELSGWKDTIDYYFEEIGEFEKKLSDIIRRNTIPHLAENADLFLNRFLGQIQNFVSLIREFTDMQRQLLKDKVPVGNELVTEQVKRTQASLREKMQSSEKAYIDLKFDCQKFLAQTTDL